MYCKKHAQSYGVGGICPDCVRVKRNHPYHGMNRPAKVDTIYIPYNFAAGAEIALAQKELLTV